MLASLALLLTMGAAEAHAPPATEKPKLVCRESEQQLGSHIRAGRRCKTAEEWQQEDLKRGQIPPSLTIEHNRADSAIPPPQSPQ